MNPLFIQPPRRVEVNRVFLFVIYAALFWWLSVKHRRTWTGFLWAIGGFLGLCLVGYIHYRMDVWTNHRIYLPVLQTILYPYAALVLIVSIFLASLPPKFRGIACRQCGYDLTGLEVACPRCPECGRQHAVVSARPLACALCNAGMEQLSSHEPACPDCRTYHLVIGPRPAHGFVETADRGTLIEHRAPGRTAHARAPSRNDSAPVAVPPAGLSDASQLGESAMPAGSTSSRRDHRARAAARGTRGW
ncbi:MAG: hypothetical protein U0638_11660 [Phycisphaerales bacterium]